MPDNDLSGFTDAGAKNPKPVLEPKNFLNTLMAAEEKADRRHLRWSKSGVTFAMTAVVALMNWMVIDMLNNVVEQEMHMIAMGSLPPGDRTVTTGVYLALIGGTVAEVSALFFIIVKSMFRQGSSENGSDGVNES